jgi:hypothetical protein
MVELYPVKNLSVAPEEFGIITLGAANPDSLEKASLSAAYLPCSVNSRSFMLLLQLHSPSETVS